MADPISASTTQQDHTSLRPGALGVAGIVFLVLAAVAPLTGIVVVASLAICLLYTSPSPRDLSTSRMPSSA